MQNIKLSYWNFYVTLIGVSLWCVCLYSNAATDNTSEYIYSILWSQFLICLYFYVFFLAFTLNQIPLMPVLPNAILPLLPFTTLRL